MCKDCLALETAPTSMASWEVVGFLRVFGSFFIHSTKRHGGCYFFFRPNIPAALRGLAKTVFAAADVE
jgi:hypothetical protein